MDKVLLLADDAGDLSKEGARRSQLLRKMALEFAGRLNSSLRIIYVTHPEKKYFKKASEEIEKKDREALHRLQNEIAQSALQIKVISQAGDPATDILEESRQKDVEMVIVGSHGRRGLKRALLGSTSEEVLRKSKVPVLILGPEAENMQFEFDPKAPLRILALTDFSSASAVAETHALELAKRMKASLTLGTSPGHEIYHMKQLLYSRNVVPTSLDTMFVEMTQKAESQLKERLELARQKGFQVERLCLQDDERLEDSIAKKAKGVYDLIVMGSHSRNRILTSYLGSTARDVILASPVPVIVYQSVIHEDW